MTEKWREVVGYTDYEVSSEGRVRSWRKPGQYGAGHRRTEPKMLLARPNAGGYPRVTLRLDGRNVYRFVHQLVLEAFVGPRPEGYVVRHLDDNPDHNILSNLTWGTQSENMYDAWRTGGRSG